MRSRIPRFALTSTLFCVGALISQGDPLTIQVSRGAGDTAKAMKVRLLKDLSDFNPAPATTKLDRFGGDLTNRSRGTGFFRVEHVDDRWWMVDPEGGRYFNLAINAVQPASKSSVIEQTSLKEKFGSAAAWANATTDLLRNNGFNGVGAWSDYDDIRHSKNPLPYTIILNLMQMFAQAQGSSDGVKVSERFKEFVPYVFDPKFEAFCRKRLSSYASYDADPWLVGVFSDNELQFPRDILDKYLALANDSSAYKAAQAWRLARHKGVPADKQPSINDEERDAFQYYALAHYYETSHRLIKEVLPNHLYLGARLHGRSTFNAGVWEAIAPHVDVISANVYYHWNPPLERLRETVNRINKPFIVTEWYAKGIDSGMPNITGAGWLVPSQADRGRFYQHFLLTLLESGGCVGSHWFCYMDNDPEDPTAGSSNHDSNKGIVNSRHEPYVELLSAMKEVNDQCYSLIRYFDGHCSKQ